MPDLSDLQWLNRYHGLSARLQAQHGLALGTALSGQPLPDLGWVAHSASAAADLGWPADWWRQALPGSPEAPSEALQVYSGQGQWPGMQPMATVYSGHQFGQWAGQLGDGRALMLGEVAGPHGAREIQLKGAGVTPYSRRGDGRAVLRSSIREFLCSEAMHGLGIPTSRALCLSASSHPVHRETVETASVVTRVAPSFLRFGHFEHFAHHRHPQAHAVLAELVDFVVDHHLPQHAGLARASTPSPERALALLEHAATTTAELMAQWQAVGFCHGVMNTDNLSILGLTLDYGPFGFLDGFDPNHICNHSDHQGRYRWRNQPDIGFWNVAALAQALSVLVPGGDQEGSEAHTRLLGALQCYEPVHVQAMQVRWRAKLGLATEHEGDASLIQDWLQLMARPRADFTITFRRLALWQAGLPPDAPANAPVRDLFLDRAAFDAWALRYSQRLRAEGSVDAERALRMNRVNPRVVLRNHLAQAAIARAQQGDFSEVQRLHDVLQHPFDDASGPQALASDADFPPAWASSIEVSCSS